MTLYTVHDSYTFEINKFIGKAAHSIKIFSNEKLPQALIDELKTLLNRRVSVDIFIGEAIPNLTESEPFYLYKLIGLGRDGANLYRGNQFYANESIICQRDFEQIIQVSLKEKDVIFLESDEDEFKTLSASFETNISAENEFQNESDDIKIELNVNNSVSLKNSYVSIDWSVENSDEIDLDGLGNVKPSGEEEFYMTESRIFNIYASNQNSKKIKSIYVAVADRPQIFYDVQFLNPSSNEFVSLPEESGNGVFGVSKGNKVRVIWEVKNAQEVSIEPFGLIEHQGEVEFYPDRQREILISASLQASSESKRILIQEFPVPIFTDELVKIEPVYLTNESFVLDDARLRAYQFLEGKTDLSYSKVSDFWKRAYSSNNELEERTKATSFGRFYAEHNIQKLNKSIGERIKNYFRNETSVIDLIKSMQKYYE